LNGAVALILRGTCNFSVKVPNAQSAGAVGVILIDTSTGSLTGWGGLGGATIPAFMVSQADGQNLQTFVDANPTTTVTLDPNRTQAPAGTLGLIPDATASFASRGPSIGNYGLKPDVSAVATNFLLAAQDVDPYGDLFSSTRYSVADGTSFASPMLAGAAALVKQAQPALTPLQVKSALVNSATLAGILNQAGTGPVAIADVGSGLLEAQNAVVSPVLFVPSTVSFGLIAGSLPPAQTLAVTNKSGTSLTYTVSPITAAPATQVLVTNSGSSISVRLSGSIPPAGRYEGVINVSGAAVPLHIPYMFLVASNTVYDVVPLLGDGFDGPVSQEIPAAYGGGARHSCDRPIRRRGPRRRGAMAGDSGRGTGTLRRAIHQHRDRCERRGIRHGGARGGCRYATVQRHRQRASSHLYGECTHRAGDRCRRHHGCGQLHAGPGRCRGFHYLHFRKPPCR
jgi:hypothetical protein